MPQLIPLIDRPIITPDMLAGSDGENINGPSLVRMPDKADGLGTYHLYFAHHGGQYIRLAYSDSLAGPWRIYHEGVLPLAAVPHFRQENGHLASPDAIWRDGKLCLAVHGMMDPDVNQTLGKDPEDITTGGQRTAMLQSTDGLRFANPSPILGSFYMRIFQHDNSDGARQL